MYVILVYDCGEKRVAKMLRLCRKYLNWIQNSVFEGDISEVKLRELLSIANSFLEIEEDSIIVFKSRDVAFMEKEIIGKECCSTENFL
ncbi:MAG: CRISPR-associated endonuclease Cas2 [Bacteroidia bacterium]|nr:CRISPR-associated endonuclease Cas2 [Bacteroidia bacterium]